MVTTETASIRFETIDHWSSLDLVEGILESQFSAVGAVQGARQQLGLAIEQAYKRLELGGRLIMIGAGTSGRIAAQDAIELTPTFNFPMNRYVVLMAGGERAFTDAEEGAEDDEVSIIEALQAHNIGENDVVIGVAASGNTPFTVSGLRFSRSIGALTIGFYNNRDGLVESVCDIPILLETGAEFLAGSTRMKAGTAQKIALNIFSTAVMIKLGYVYRGRMVNVLANNIKLQGRSVSMVVDLTGCAPDKAKQALEKCDYNVKIAVVMVELELSLEQAQRHLDKHDGFLRDALRDNT